MFLSFLNPVDLWNGFCMITVKFLNFRTPETYAVIYLKFEQRPILRVLLHKGAKGIANSEDPDQTAPRVFTVCQTNLST